MISGYPIWVVLMMGLGIFFASFIDSICGGGGVISLPVYLLAGLPTHHAIGTAKLSSCVGMAASVFRHVKSGFIDWKLAIPSIPFALVGAYFGTALQIALDEKFLKYLLLIVLPIVAVILFRQKTFPDERGDIAVWKQRCIVWVASFVLGAYDGFYGPGSSTFMLLCFCHLAKLDLRTASGNMKLVTFAANIGGLITSAVAGKVLFPIGLITAAFSVAGHYIGSGLTIKNGSRIVRPVVFVVLAMLTVKVIVDLVVK